MQKTETTEADNLLTPATQTRSSEINLETETIGIVERSGNFGNYAAWHERHRAELDQYSEAIKPAIAQLNAMIESGVPHHEAYAKVRIPPLSDFIKEQAA